MNTPRSVVIAGAVAHRPRRGGHTWVFLQYLLGFRDLGWDVLFLDRLEADDKDGIPYLEQVMSRAQVEDYSVLYDGGEKSFGLSRTDVLEKVGKSAFVLNVNGFFDDEEVLERAPMRVFLDIDPGFWQMWCALGLHDAFRGHDAYVTVGENIGDPDCKIPTCGLDWITTPQPVVLEHWLEQSPGGDRFTSVGSWRGPFGPVDYEGETYGLRAHEFRKFAELPRLVKPPFEIALDIHEAEVDDLKLLRSNNWSIVDPEEVAKDPWVYQSYIQTSMAEFGVAKNMYVRANSGWFSDRSICYLASGKPVLAQDTGFSRRYGAGEGLLAFSTPEEAVAGAEAISADYPRHAKAARALAEEHFDSRKVLGRLVDLLGVA
jgi:hypothetical protein